MVLQTLREQLHSIYSALKFFQILFTYITEVIHELNILQKIFQDLTQYDKLVMQLT